MRRLAAGLLLALAGTRLHAQHEMHTSATSTTTWRFSYDANANVVYDNQRTQRGDTQLALIDWEMFTLTRRTLSLHLMTSLEPFTLGGSGYAELLQTGGSYRHAYLHDRMHPHQAIMELAARYVMGPLTLYAGAVGEPSAGPTLYLHRASAAKDPFAPLSHHWQDASHMSNGVLRAGYTTAAVTLEGSIWNAREADEGHLVADFRGARLDSYGGRITWRAAPALQLRSWWSYLGSHNRLDPDERMHRYGGSLEYKEPQWAASVIYGMNLHHHTGSSHLILHGGPNASPHHHASSLLAEASVNVAANTTLFSRAERVMKSGEELGFLGGDLTELYDVRALSAGVVRPAVRHVAIGARGAVTFVPQSLLATYGTRTPLGMALFAQLTP